MASHFAAVLFPRMWESPTIRGKAIASSMHMQNGIVLQGRGAASAGIHDRTRDDTEVALDKPFPRHNS